jgi:hypothetical protein
MRWPRTLVQLTRIGLSMCVLRLEMCASCGGAHCTGGGDATRWAGVRPFAGGDGTAPVARQPQPARCIALHFESVIVDVCGH